MTFSILARDMETNEIGGAATTGSYCVGGWVLRGSLDSGLSASQGASASTIWGEKSLDYLKDGKSAEDTIQKVISNDDGREYRQLSCMTLMGDTHSFTGKNNVDYYYHHSEKNLVIAGNMLASKNVITSMVDFFKKQNGDLATKLINTLKKGEDEGSDIRGLKSSCLLVLHADRPPLTLRIDNSNQPLKDLEKLLKDVTSDKYYEWTKTVPTKNNQNKYK